jgi:hypothetical protein
MKTVFPPSFLFRIAIFLLGGVVCQVPAAENPNEIVIPSSAASDSTIGRAEQLFRMAQRRQLDDGLAGEAASLLDDADPFVRGIAEWAIATKVNLENNGQEIVWPRPEPPDWYRRWTALEGDFLLDADYVRQGAPWGIHHQPASMLGSVDLILKRAAGAFDELTRGDTDEVGRRAARRQLEQLRAIRQELARQIQVAPDDLTAQRRLWLQARRTARAIVLARPAIDFDQLVYIQRHVALFANITGSQYPWAHKPGGGIYVQQGLDPGSTRSEVLDGQLGPGHVHGIDLAWDADRVVFGYARQPDWPPPWDTISGDYVFLLRGHQPPTHLYEIGLDGNGLKPLTAHEYWSDFEPTYCADDSVVFASDRSGRSSECGKFSADHTVINLYRVFPDTGRVVRLNDNKDIDRYPHSLDNGQIAYTRWDYQERHFMETHAVWTVRPDGTMADALFNQHLRPPYGLRDTRSVPGSQKLVSIATGHHTFAYGPVVLIDARHGINHPDSLEIVTPRVVPQEGPMAGRPVASGGPPDRGGVYKTPWALSETCFLASYSYSSSLTATGFAVYLVDVYGNKELLARDLVYSCSFPMPLKRRPRPPQLPDILQDTASAAQTAVGYVADVYQDLEGIPRGQVKYLRIAQRVGWPLDSEIGAMRYIPGNAWSRQFGHWNWAPVRVIGEVPVEEDGSAQFVVPADAALYFQALDEQRMELRRMRTHVTLQAGETRGCTGCHESRLQTPRTTWQPSLALLRPPSIPEPPPWGADRLLGYQALIQPILNQQCVRCHDRDDPDGGIDLSDTPTADGFYQSFATLFGRHPNGEMGKAWISIADRLSDSSVTQPRQFGSHRSPLIGVLRDDPLHRKEAPLSDEQWRTLVTWIDANAPYHDRFYNRRPADGGPPRREIEPRIDCPLSDLVSGRLTQDQTADRSQ